MLGFVFGFIMLISFSALGIKIGKKYTESLRFWTDFHQFNTISSIKIPAYKANIRECVDELNKDTFSNVTTQFLTGCPDPVCPSFLKKEEFEYISSYFYKLKTLDFQSLNTLFVETHSYVSNKREDAKILCDKNVKTCKKLGILAGIAAFIFVV